MSLKTDTIVNDMQASIETLAGKLGLVLLVFGGMHFFNLFVFNKMRASALESNLRERALQNYGGPQKPGDQYPYSA